jgi:hypothetical protein
LLTIHHRDAAKMQRHKLARESDAQLSAILREAVLAYLTRST